MKKSIHSFSLFFLSTLLVISSCGGPSETSEQEESTDQEQQITDNRASPLRKVEGEINGKKVLIQYGSPAVNERAIYGDLVPYNEVWRTGANEATYVEFSEDVSVEGEPLAAGRYSLFTIPRKTGPWTVIFNSEWDLEHGHYQYKEEHDVLRVNAIPTWENQSQERLSVEIENSEIVVKWEKLRLPIHVE
ncbi:DUF2911 domain-containing protein [Pleomorphovibrio marinus]|uniref:DUF2911 domain-containing protein n=1 Tax=Pleomorphovibrio marinus TaxID=2164132 RepID=UPI000E0CA381|nr:DUF2911 domain-containing protein [Pleomorphovibrio marinus]